MGGSLDGQQMSDGEVSHLKLVSGDSLPFSVGITIERFREVQESTGLAQLICILHIRSGSSAGPSGITGGGTNRPGHLRHLSPTLSSSPKSYWGRNRVGKQPTHQLLRQTYSGLERVHDLGECNTLKDPPELEGWATAEGRHTKQWQTLLEDRAALHTCGAAWAI